ncbi:MAG: 23S rRNA (adenine(2503)-C(2))-methyltransferase RlmN, partial [Alphaproteobacteria bacterium]|nr:23S rRNA (adenine(2503)-C(2))-methyltransferase RlmN [Alphaproteobacteria bacterium]
MSSSVKPNLIGLTREGLKTALAGAGIEAKHLSMRAGQLWNALYVQGATDFEQVTTLAKPLRRELSEKFSLSRPEIVAAQTSDDGTRKWLIRFGPGIEIETVFIPDEERGTLCVSSQVGCTLNCRFCHTGTQKLVRNLTSHEIVSQLMVARDSLAEWPH